MNIDFSKVLTLSARILVAVCLTCLFLLFFPERMLPFDISSFRQENGLWIFVVFISSASLLVSYLGKWLLEFAKDKITTRKLWVTYKAILRNLSNQEKMFLKDYYKKNETFININLSNPMHKKLQTFNVIAMTAGTNAGSLTSMPAFIQPWVFEIIKRNPSILEIKQEEQSNDK